MDSIIKIKDLHFSYDGPKILENIEIDIQRNEFIGMVGPNGSGKTTLLKIIMGVLTPDEGSIEVLGKSPFQSVKEIGYMPQLTPFSRDFPISVEEVVLMGRLGKTSSIGFFNKADKRAAEKSMNVVEILDLRKRAIGSLSGGQLQRVLIARALTCEPKIMILDEPTANVDMKIEKDIKFSSDNKTISIKPSKLSLDIDFEIKYKNPLIKNQRNSIEILRIMTSIMYRLLNIT